MNVNESEYSSDSLHHSDDDSVACAGDLYVVLAQMPLTTASWHDDAILPAVYTVEPGYMCVDITRSRDVGRRRFLVSTGKTVIITPLYDWSMNFRNIWWLKYLSP